MPEPFETIERDDYFAAIYVDTDPFNPRAEFDEPGTLLVQLSDRHVAPSKTDEQDWRYDAVRRAWEHGRDVELVERYARAFLGAAAVAWWDDPRGTSRVVCLIDRDSDWTDPASAAVSVLSRYTAWCEGDVYGYVVNDPNGNEIDSCWGFFGDTELPYVRECIGAAIDAHRAGVHAERVALFRQLVNH